MEDAKASQKWKILSRCTEFQYKMEGEVFPELKEGLKISKTIEQVTVDISQVNIAKEGKYNIIYYYTDTSGKKYEKSVTCTVIDSARDKTSDRTDSVSDNGSAMQSGMAEPVRTGERRTFSICYMLCIYALSVASIAVIYRHIRCGKI